MKKFCPLIIWVLFCASKMYCQGNVVNDSLNKTDSKGFKQGKWTEYFDSKKPKSICTYVDNQVVGEYLSYYKNGKIQSQIQFNGGKKTGIARYYNDDGTLSDLYIIDDDIVLWHGMYYKDGRIQMEQIYKNGVPSIGINYKNGVFAEDYKIR